MKMIKNKNYKRTVLIIGIALALLLYLMTAAINKYPPFYPKSQVLELGEQTINMDKTDTEKEAIRDLEEDPEKKLQNSQTDTPNSPEKTSSDGKQVVNVLLTNVGVLNTTVSASGMVTNTAEEDGQCTFTFRNGDRLLTRNSDALANPTSTTCTTVSFSSSELPVSGIWRVTLHYESDLSVGDSGTKEFTK